MEPEIVNSVQENSGSIWVIVSTIAAAVSAVFAAAAAGISLWQAREFQKRVKVASQFSKIRHTLEMAPFYSEEYIKCLEEIYDYCNQHNYKKNITINDWSVMKKDLKLNSSFSKVLHYWRRFSICYFEDTMDKEVAKTACKDGFLNFAGQFEIVLLELKKSKGIELVLKLYEEWKK